MPTAALIPEQGREIGNNNSSSLSDASKSSNPSDQSASVSSNTVAPPKRAASSFLLSFDRGFVSENSPLAGKIDLIKVSDRFKGVKLSIDIFLSHRVPETALAEFARTVVEAEGGNFERIFMSYWLPGMVYGAGCWATSHYESELSIKILGATIAQKEAMLRMVAEGKSDDVLGHWSAMDTIPPHVWRLTRDGSTLLLRLLMTDGVSDGTPHVALRWHGKTVLVAKRDLKDFNRSIAGTEYWEVAQGELILTGIGDPISNRYKYIDSLGVIGGTYVPPFINAEFKSGVYTPFRLWKSHDGIYEVSARFAGLINDIVRLEKEDLTVVEVPLNKFSESDLEFIQSKK